jgi:hypothetical protein
MLALATLCNSRPIGVTFPRCRTRRSGKAAPDAATGCAAAPDSQQTHLTPLAHQFVCLGCGTRWSTSAVPGPVQREGTCPRCAWPVTKLTFVTRPAEPALDPARPVWSLGARQPGTWMTAALEAA